MFIVHVVRQFRPGIGGIENMVLKLALAQVAAGHKVRIVTLNRLFKDKHNRVLAGREMVEGAEIVRVPFVGSSRYPLAPSALKFIRHADLVHVHAIDFFFDYFAWTKPLHRKKLVVSTHGGFFHTPYGAWFKRFYFEVVTRVSLTWYDAVVAVSHSDYELFSRLRHRGILCIENGVDIAKFADAAAPQSTKAIAWIGRFSTNKRIDRAIKFLAALHQRDKEWSLHIAGSPWDIDPQHITAIAEKEGVAGSITIASTPSEAQIRQIISRCSVLVSSSEFEGFGIAAVEGLSAGLFPVLSDIPPFRRLNEHTGAGMLVDFSKPEPAAEQFLSRWREVSTNYQTSRTGLMMAANTFDWQRAFSAYMDVYQRLLGQRRRRILDVAVTVSTRSEVVEELDRRVDESINTIVAFANAHCLNIAHRDPSLRAALGQAVVLNDGVGLDIASKLLFGAQFPDNLNGTDFTPYYLQHTRHSLRIFLLGGRSAVVDRAAKLLAQKYSKH